MICTSHDVFYRKDVLFGGVIDNTAHLKSNPQTHHFGGVNRHFQAK